MSTSAPGALLLFGGVGLAYWAIFGNKGLLKHSPDRQTILSNIGNSSGGGVTVPPSGTPTDFTGNTDVYHFAEAIAAQETGGGPQSYLRTQNGQAPSYEALLNIKHGAFGKYQMLPGTYRSLSTHYFGRVVVPTPQVQDYIAQKQFQRMHDSSGSWALVAFKWRNGHFDPNVKNWTLGSVRYVNTVNCYLKNHFGSQEGWGMISLLGHVDRKGQTYNDQSSPFGPFANCGKTATA